MQATVVFEKNWNSLYAKKDNGDRKYRYIINSGSSRSSKTYSIIQLFYLYAISTPNKKLSVFRDTKQICKQTVLEDMKKIYVDMPGFSSVKFNITESIFTFPNKSAIHIEGTDDSIKIHGYHCDILWLNESYAISRETFDQLDMRCAEAVLVDLNPRSTHWSEDVVMADNAIKIHSTFKDNPFCPAEQKIKILSYQPVSLSTVVLSGKMNEVEAVNYNLILNEKSLSVRELNELLRCRENEIKKSANPFSWEVYGRGEKAERPNRIFHFEEISDEIYKAITTPIYNATDWGTVDPWGIIEAKYYDGGLYIHELNYTSENELRGKLNATELAQINAENEEIGIVRWMFEKLSINKSNAVICDTNRPLKIALLRRCGYNAIPALKGAGSIEDGIDLLNNMRVYYTASSINLKYEQENYSRRVDRFGIVLEEPEDLNNHILDCCRYVCGYLVSLGIIKQF